MRLMKCAIINNDIPDKISLITIFNFFPLSSSEEFEPGARALYIQAPANIRVPANVRMAPIKNRIVIIEIIISFLIILSIYKGIKISA